MRIHFETHQERDEIAKAILEVIEWMRPDKERNYLLTDAARERLTRAMVGAHTFISLSPIGGD